MSVRMIVVRKSVLVGLALALLVGAALGWLLLLGSAQQTTAPGVAALAKLVVIDPGHGGPDPGAVGVGGTLEKDVVLAVAELLEPMLHATAIRTLRLREGDYDMVERHGHGGSGSRKRTDLLMRAQIANQAGADLFLSLHANSFPSPKWSGAQTFYDPSQPESRRFAQALQHRLRQAVPENTRVARPGDYLVLKETSMPAVVIEVGFLSNPDEERLLNTESYRKRLARAIYQGIVDYLLMSAESGEEHGAGVVETSAEAPFPYDEADLAPGEYRLYFQSSENERDGLEAVIANFPVALLDQPLERRIAYVFSRLAAGPPPESDLAPLFPPGAKVLDISIDGELLMVDLSREVRTRFWGGGRSEELLIEGMLRTAAQFEGVRRLLISVEGDVEEPLAGHIDISQSFEVIGSQRAR